MDRIFDYELKDEGSNPSKLTQKEKEEIIKALISFICIGDKVKILIKDSTRSYEVEIYGICERCFIITSNRQALFKVIKTKSSSGFDLDLNNNLVYKF